MKVRILNHNPVKSGNLAFEAYHSSFQGMAPLPQFILRNISSIIQKFSRSPQLILLSKHLAYFYTYMSFQLANFFIQIVNNENKNS